MLKALFWAALGTGFPFLMTALGAATVLLAGRGRRALPQQGLFGFAAGVMSAAAVWSLLLPALEQAAGGALPHWLPASAGLLLGALLLSALDALAARLYRHEGEAQRRQNALLMTAITLHNIPEGMAVGLAFALAASGEGRAGAAALALGIGIQNFPEGAAVSLPRVQDGRGRAFAAGVLSGAVEPLFGCAVVLAAEAAGALMPWLLSFAAGAMLYVTAAELLPQAGSRAGAWGFVAGFGLMMVLDTALG